MSMDKSKILTMNIEVFNEMKKIEEERNKWRMIANKILQEWCDTFGITRQTAIEKYFPEIKEME